MLIRSQDKEQLLNIDSVKTIGICERGKCFAIFIDNLYFGGNYSSKEKVIKVLDMIQEAYEKYEYEKVFKTGITLLETFQMPDDAEVEV